MPIKLTRILLVVFTLIQILNLALMGILIKAMETGAISKNVFGGFEVVVVVTLIANIIMSYTYAEDTKRNAGLWGLGAFIFFFFIPIVLAVLPIPKAARTHSYSWAASGATIKKTLLDKLLTTQPEATKKQVGQAMAEVPGNFEFVVSVNIPDMQKHMDAANKKGFMVWCNEDGKLAILYGAGMVDQSSFAGAMTWLKDIRRPGQPVMAHFLSGDEERMLEIK